jgi:hypothetical protein
VRTRRGRLFQSSPDGGGRVRDRLRGPLGAGRLGQEDLARGFEGNSVIVIWDGAGTTVVGTTYENAYAWIMTLINGQVVDGTAFNDSISFNELWKVDPVGA